MIPRDNRESVNQSNQNSNIYINIIIKRHNRPHNLRTIMDNYKSSWKKLIDESSDKFYLQKCLKVENLDKEIIYWIKEKLSKLNDFCDCDLTETDEPF